MKKQAERVSALVLAAALMTLVLTYPAEAEDSEGKRKGSRAGRTVEGTYRCPCDFQIGAPNGPTVGINPGGGDTFRVATRARERFVTLDLRDDSGNPVQFSISQASGVRVASGCGDLEKPARIPKPGRKLHFYIYSGTCNGGVANAEGGTYAVTLSTKR